MLQDHDLGPIANALVSMRQPDRLRITLRQVEALRAAARLGTATAAADALGLTQPAVSRLVSELERGIGFRLFERHARGLVLTDDGKRLLIDVDRAYHGLEAIADAANAIKRQASGQARLVSLAVYADGFVADAVGRFMAENPGVEVESSVDSRPGMTAALALERFDLGVCTAPSGSEAVEAIELGKREGVLVFPPGKAPDAVGWSVFEQPVLVLPVGNPFRASFDATLAAAGVLPRIRGEFRNQRAACRACLAGGGFAMVEAQTAAEFVGSGIEIRPFPGGLSWTVAVLRPRRRTLSAAAVRLIAHLKAAF